MTSFAARPERHTSSPRPPTAACGSRPTAATRGRSIGDGLPTQVVSGIAWTPADGGTLIVLTGDNAFGGDIDRRASASTAPTDGGATLDARGRRARRRARLQARRRPDATRARSTPRPAAACSARPTRGASFANVNLPTGDCARRSRPPTAKDCFLANMVTDVVVQGAGEREHAGTDAKPGAVLAAVGWRAGTKPNADGSPQSPGNGMYALRQRRRRARSRTSTSRATPRRSRPTIR